MNPIGIMQGRLVPPENGKIQAFPRKAWEKEFLSAAQAKLDCIEWIYDGYGEGVNPFGSKEGIEKLKALTTQHGVQVRSVCADYFMEFPFVRATSPERTERLNKLKWLLTQGESLGIKRMVLPFVDQSAMRTNEDKAAVLNGLKEVLPFAEQCEVELHLETSLAPQDFKEFLNHVPHPFIKVNYDSGNSASLGHDVNEEFDAYGERVGSVHIKDRVRGGSTVPLATGDTDFDGLFQCLRHIDYKGDFILQVARGTSGDEVEWAKKNREFVIQHLKRNMNEFAARR